MEINETLFYNCLFYIKCKKIYQNTKNFLSVIGAVRKNVLPFLISADAMLYWIIIGK